jgi:hypothetical protein
LSNDVLDEPQFVAELGEPKTKVPQRETQLTIRVVYMEEDGMEEIVLGRCMCAC